MASDLDKVFDQATEDERIEFLAKMMAQDLLTKEQALAILESRESNKVVNRSGRATIGQRVKSGFKRSFSWLGHGLATFLFVIVKILYWLLMAPFFLLSFVKNWFFMGLGLWLICWFFDLVVRSFVTKQTTTSMNDNITTIIVIIAGVLSLIGTALQYKGEID